MSGRAAACAILLALATAARAQAPYDLILRNGRIVDGTGSAWYRGEVAIRGDTIVRIAPRVDAPARRVIDVEGAVVSPGFIDLHTHLDRGIRERPTADNYVRQGVTTILAGPDGGSAVPLGPFLDRLEALPRSVNVGSFIGQGSVREHVVGMVDRKPTAAEMDRMRGVVEQGMRDGAFGMSTGLFYTPGTWTPTAEVIELARVVARFGGMHNSHMRTEGRRVVESVKETIAIGEEGGLPTHISHHKASGTRAWGKTVETLALVDAARARGVDVTLDVYPYTASATSLQAALPPWARDGGEMELRKRLADEATRARIRAEVERTLRGRGFGDDEGGNMRFSGCPFDRGVAGKTLEEATSLYGLEPTVENVAETVLAFAAKGGCRTITFGQDEADVTRVIAHPASMIASDGEVPSPGQGAPHPRSYGTFARVLAVYVRERGVLHLEDAVRKMTSFPAMRIGIADRGVLRPGMKADIAVFDPGRVRDLATYDDPHRYAEGFSHVIVNGEVVFEQGAMTAARPGRVLYGPARARPD